MSEPQKNDRLDYDDPLKNNNMDSSDDTIPANHSEAVKLGIATEGILLVDNGAESPNSALSPLGNEQVPLLAGENDSSASGILNHGKPPLNKLKSQRRHNRMVSWGIDGPPPGLYDAPEDVVSATGMGSTEHAPSETRSKLSLQAVLNASPYEDEAEAYIQRSLDEVDVSKAPGINDAQHTILGSVPQDATATAFGTIGSPHPRSHNRKKPTHHRMKSTAENLFTLALDFEDLEKHAGVNMDGKGGSQQDGIAMSNADALARNGAVLVKRHRLDSTADKKETKGEQANLPTTQGIAADGPHPPPRPSMGRRMSVKRMSMVKLSSVRFPHPNSRDDSKKSDTPSSADIEAPIAFVESDDDGDNDGNNDGDNDEINNTVHISDDNEESRDVDSVDEYKDGKRSSRLKLANNRIKANYKDFEDWLKYNKMGYKQYAKVAIMYFILPLVGVAAVLFYLGDNPPCGTRSQCLSSKYLVNNETKLPTPTPLVDGGNSTSTIEEPKVTVDSLKFLLETAAVSWWLLFLARQIVTFSLAKLLEAVLIEYMALRSRICVWLLGPFVTLFLVQSKGWPMVCFLWSFLDFLLLYGGGEFAEHWLYYQSIGLFNRSNPGGMVTSSPEYRVILVVLMVVAVLVAVKRFWLGIFLGRQTFLRYADELAKAMKKALLIGRVAARARDIERQTYNAKKSTILWDPSKYLDRDDTSRGDATTFDDDTVKSNTNNDLLEGMRMNSEQKFRVMELLGAWEEPEAAKQKDDKTTISGIIQFRSSLSRLNTSHPFGTAFGPANNRKECIESIETVYQRLTLGYPPGRPLHFNTMAGMAVRNDEDLDNDLLKDLVKLFRPDRDGNLTLLDFAKSVDASYKELRLLRASVASSSMMDRAFEGIINVGFYFILFCIVLGIIGIDPFVLFASISGFVLGFAFMIGSACSKYFEGILFILLRHPYDVGDRIAISNVNNETPMTGSLKWIVKDINLFSTTMVFVPSNEVATYSNGSLAASRVINGARSMKATLLFFFKFPIGTPYQRIQVFRGSIEKYMKARPREWIGLIGFRVIRVEADLGFVEYIIHAQHRESWQQNGSIQDSRGELAGFAVELMKKMNIFYRTPSMPVDLTLKKSDLAGFPFPEAGSVTHRGRAESGVPMEGVPMDGDTSYLDTDSIEMIFKA